MAQSYFAKSHTPTALVQEPSLEAVADRAKAASDAQGAYLDHKNRLVQAIDATQQVIGDLRDFCKDKWAVRYPKLQQVAEETVLDTTTTSSPRRTHPRRSLSFADDPTSETHVVLSPGKNMQRSMTLAAITDVPEEFDATEHTGTEHDGGNLIPTAHADNFHVIKLDLKIGANGASPASLVHQLEKSSIANLLDDRLGNSSAHVAKLRLRIEDTSSKVLVTGDLNAGKSTFVNALLRRYVMPVDQQPCTTAFCEVHDASENKGVEEVHIVQDGSEYNIADESTFTRAGVSDLEAIISENEDGASSMKIKVYLNDTVAPEESLINNGIVDISLIDAPGLNRDSTKTTAVFARQEEIDVVIFVVSAENHFTLSGKEFLWNASMEKAYVFVVVNKYDGIRDKAKCRRLVLDQIKQLSPRTYENAEELVHFVDSANSSGSPAFAGLQAALRTFILEKRGKSKLAPAATYLSHLLADVELLVSANALAAQDEHDAAKDDLARVKPILDKMKAAREIVENGIENIEEDGTKEVLTHTKSALENALARIGQGELAISGSLPSYPGPLNVFDYARDVRAALLESIDTVVKQVEDDARVTTTTGVNKVNTLGEEHLPAGSEKNRRVFMPEAMFRQLSSKKVRRTSGPVTSGLGLGLAQRSDLLETTFLDIFDAQYVLWDQFASESSPSKETEETAVTAIGALSVGLGALTMVGGSAMGARGVLEAILRLTDLLNNEKSRKWAAPLIGALVLAGSGYLILDLPHSVPRTVGRRICRELLARSGGDASGLLGAAALDEPAFTDAQAERISRETRKVLRLAGFDLRERFRASLEENAKHSREAEEKAKTAKIAQEYFAAIAAKTGTIRADAGFASPKLGF